MTPATQILVGQALNAFAGASKLNVSAQLDSREIHMYSASAGTVNMTVTVPAVWHALTSTVGTHALAPVAAMPTARCETTVPSAHVPRDLLAIHWLVVTVR